MTLPGVNRILSSFATQNSTNLDGIRLSNAVKICRFLSFLGAKFIEKYWRIIIRQSFQLNFDNIQHHSTRSVSNAVEFCIPGSKNLREKSCQILLSKKTVVCWRLLLDFVEECKKILSKKIVITLTIFLDNIFIPFSTFFLLPGARLFVKYQTKICSKNVCKILQKYSKICRKTMKFVKKYQVFMQIYSEKYR